ncbi:MAG: S24/S26 family peptidase [Actinomycetota bacterium]
MTIPTLRGWFPVRVAGESMLPTLRPGDALAVRPIRPTEPRRGQIVVVRSGSLEIVKRVVAVPGERGLSDGHYWVQGDNAEASTDSRARGPVARGDIAGVARVLYLPLRRIRLLR